MKLIYLFDEGSKLIVTETAVAQLKSYAQQFDFQSEAGGVLLGRHLLESKNIVVDEVTLPQPQDKRGRFSFFRSKKHSDIALRRWHETNSTAAYLGLWHTHPEPVPEPSPTDRTDWNKASKKDSYEGERLFFVIVGTETIKVWSKFRTGKIENLQPISE
jgi:integrative and conjugative element protein (TIGR02256 family)